MCRVHLPEEDATVFAEVQSVAILLLYWVVLLKREVHELPVHVVARGEDQVIAELHIINIDITVLLLCLSSASMSSISTLLYRNCFSKVT